MSKSAKQLPLASRTKGRSQCYLKASRSFDRGFQEQVFPSKNWPKTYKKQKPMDWLTIVTKHVVLTMGMFLDKLSFIILKTKWTHKSEKDQISKSTRFFNKPRRFVRTHTLSYMVVFSIKIQHWQDNVAWTRVDHVKCSCCWYSSGFRLKERFSDAPMQQH